MHICFSENSGRPGRPKRFIFTLIVSIITITFISGVVAAGAGLYAWAFTQPKPAPNAG